jgi:hypothetical protein
VSARSAALITMNHDGQADRAVDVEAGNDHVAEGNAIHGQFV